GGWTVTRPRHPPAQRWTVSRPRWSSSAPTGSSKLPSRKNESVESQPRRGSRIWRRSSTSRDGPPTRRAPRPSTHSPSSSLGG
ncbi:hypothetical protein T484DRAFT_1894805, partial [Baffinella frigidus]